MQDNVIRLFVDPETMDMVMVAESLPDSEYLYDAEAKRSLVSLIFDGEAVLHQHLDRGDETWRVAIFAGGGACVSLVRYVELRQQWRRDTYGDQSSSTLGY